jgi:phosphopantetheine adenylyltransferase
MKASVYTIESNALIATISRGVKTKFDWLLEIQTKCGGELISYNYQTIFLTKKNAVKEFNKLKSSPFLIKA